MIYSLASWIFHFNKTGGLCPAFLNNTKGVVLSMAYILALIGGIIFIIIYNAKGDKKMTKLEKFIKKFSNDNPYKDIEKVAEKLDLNENLIAIIQAIESSFNRFAMSDKVKMDDFGYGHYSSFGLGQIRTYKPDGKYSTFDRLVKLGQSLDVIDKKYDQIARNNDVKKAILSDKESLLFNTYFNTLLTGLYLYDVKKEHSLEDLPENFLSFAFYYNCGNHADIKDYPEWEKGSYAYRVKKYKKELDI